MAKKPSNRFWIILISIIGIVGLLGGLIAGISVPIANAKKNDTSDDNAKIKTLNNNLKPQIIQKNKVKN